MAFDKITTTVMQVAQAIKDNVPTDMHPDLYDAVMGQTDFQEEHLMAALGHLVDNKAQGTSFVRMVAPHRILWIRTFLCKYYGKQ